MLGIMLILAGAAAPDSAGPEVPSPPASVSSQTAKPIVVQGNRRVCHETTSTGSIIPKRVCKTADQWQQEIAASQAFAAQRARELTTYQQMQIYIQNQQKNKDN